MLGLRLGARAAAIAAILFVAACANTTQLRPQAATIAWSDATRKVLVMDVDIELGLLTAGGLVEPRADWTQAAKGFAEAETRRILGAKNVEPVFYDDVASLSDNPRDDQLVKLFNAVGRAILVHAYAKSPALPHKKSAFDWTIGEGAQTLRERFGADYALFSFVRDSYSSGSRQAMIFFGALLGVGIPGGVQQGFAALVDLRTGNIAWFNVLVSQGDLRTEGPARQSMENLLGKVPL